MEKELQLKSFKKLTCCLSEIMIRSKIEPTEKEILCQKIKDYLKIGSIDGLEALMNLYHIVNNHDKIMIKLNCGDLHCVLCYSEIISLSSNYNLECSCSCIISPKDKYKIQIEMNRFLSSLKICLLCGEKKSSSFHFSLRQTHPCEICNDCLIQKYNLEKNVAQMCPVCDEQYNEESNFYLQNLKALNSPSNIVIEFFKDKCFQCATEKDSRVFQKICELSHSACNECIRAMNNREEKFCSCGLPCSIINYYY